jgi:hypothetical protein
MMLVLALGRRVKRRHSRDCVVVDFVGRISDLLLVQY